MNLKEYLKCSDRILVLDGALATQLEARGCDLNDPLWSTKILIDNPQEIEAVGTSYLENGARCLITASYQATTQALMERCNMSEDEAIAIIKSTVDIAKRSRETYLNKLKLESNILELPEIFIAGSVGPYGAYLADGSEYHCEYKLSEKEFQDFHRARIAALLDSGVDVLAIETQPSAAEVKAIVKLLQSEFPNAVAWIAFTINRNATDLITDGTQLSEIIPFLNESDQVIAIGVNCIPLKDTTLALENMSKFANKPLIAYPNSHEIFDVIEWLWKPAPEPFICLADQCESWIKAGARLIGGCCRTTPTDIRNLRDELKRQNRQL